jgi:hypothetical protein
MFLFNENHEVHEIMWEKYGTARKARDCIVMRHGKDVMCVADSYGKNTYTH